MKIFQGNKMRYIALIMSMESDIRMKEFFKMDMIGIIYMMSKILKISNYVTKFRIWNTHWIQLHLLFFCRLFHFWGIYLLYYACQGTSSWHHFVKKWGKQYKNTYVTSMILYHLILYQQGQSHFTTLVSYKYT